MATTVTLRTNLRAEERVGRKYHSLLCLAVDARKRFGKQGAIQTRYLFRCDCGRECRKWWSSVCRLMQDGRADCGCGSPMQVNKRLRQVSLSKAVAPVVAHWPNSVFGVGMQLRDWASLTGTSFERVRQRFRDKSPVVAIAPYPLAVEFVKREIERKRVAGEITDMEADQDIAALLKAAKDAKPVEGANYKSRFSAYDGVLQELHAKGYGPSAAQRWFAERGIDFRLGALANRYKKLGLVMRPKEPA